VKTFRETYGPWAIVTGASSGIGEALARELAGRGVSVILVARRRDRLDALAAALAGPVQTLVVELDLGGDDAVDTLLTAVGERDVGLVCANAGFGDKGAFTSADRGEMRRMIRLNCESTAALAHAFVPRLAARGRGGLMIVASLAAFQGTPWTTVYAATKAFDLLLAEGLHEELRPLGVDVVALCPGATDTEGPRRTGVDATRIPFGMASAGDVARAGLDGLGRGCVVLPRRIDHLAALATRLVPRAIASRLAGRTILRVAGRGEEDGK
jgi:short-subunit dehydrogenase